MRKTLLLAIYILFVSTCICNSHRQVQGQSATSAQSNVVLPSGDPPSGHVTLLPKSFPPWQVGSPNQNFKILQLCNRVGHCGTLCENLVDQNFPYQKLLGIWGWTSSWAGIQLAAMLTLHMLWKMLACIHSKNMRSYPVKTWIHCNFLKISMKHHDHNWP